MNSDFLIELIPQVISDLRDEYPDMPRIIRDDIFGILEKNCVVVYYPIADNNGGFHTRRYVQNSLKDFVYINTEKELSEQVFTAAHEFGHVINVVDRICNVANYREELSVKESERLINRFAAELLMPTEEFKAAVNQTTDILHIENGPISVVSLIRIAVYLMNDFMVSFDAIIRRLVETGYLHPDIENIVFENGKYSNVIEVFLKELNTVLDKKTMKKTIPGLRDIVNQAEASRRLDAIIIAKVKNDFDIADIPDVAGDNINRSIELSVKGDSNGEE